MSVAPGRTALLLLLVAALCACAQLVPRDSAHFKVEDSDFSLVAAAALRLVERTAAVTTFVIDAGLDPRAVAALKRLRPVMRRNDVLPSAELALPDGYFVIENFSIEDDTAMFEGQLGPITRSAENRNLPGCGLRFSVAFYWQVTSWANHSYKVIDCAKTRSGAVQATCGNWPGD